MILAMSAMRRRTFLRTVGVSAAAAAWLPGLRGAAEAAAGQGWRTFEVTTRLEVAGAAGATKAWVPVPLLDDTAYQKRLGDAWSGNAARIEAHRDDRYRAGMVYAEWPAGTKTPVLEVVSRFSTRDRTVDLERPDPRAPRESRSALARYLEPTALLPTDGVVLDKSREITKGHRTDLAKARAIYEWIVDNTFRDPEVRGCGIGDIRFMLESGDLGGKCADLNALFVGLARAAGVPARDVYGIRVADSTTFKSLGKSGDVSKAQHCRAEFHADGFGWVPVDPADVRKVVLEEPPGGRSLDDPLVRRARGRLFGAWEMNWLAYNYAHDVALPGSSGPPLGFLMYPQAESSGTRRDSLDPATFKYEIRARELAG